MNVLDEIVVVKRSGQRINFNGSKIAVAIKGAFDDVSNTYKLEEVNKVYESVLKYITSNYQTRRTINVEDIQDIIEQVLKKENKDVYDAFVRYRTRRAESRKVFSLKQQHKFVKVIEKVNNISSLDIPSFDEYKNYFYKTDHHWNYKGSYKGYTDIANLMNLDILDIKDEVCFDIPFSGSKTRDLAGINLITETSCMYTFDMPDFDIYISGEKVDNYGNPIDELKSSHEITYGNMYGFDYDEILFVNKNSNNNKKLLIFSNSFSNAINKLLASNYKETYVLDERHYENLNLIDYINSKKIDDVLILGNHMLFIDSVNW